MGKREKKSLRKKNMTTFTNLNDNFLILAFLACFSLAIGCMARYLDSDYVSSVAPPEADTPTIPIVGGMYIVAILIFVALVFYGVIRKQKTKGEVDFWLLFRGLDEVRLRVLRGFAFVFCLAVLGFAVVNFVHVNFFANLAYILFFGLGILALLHFFTIWIGLIQSKKVKQPKESVTAKTVFLKITKVVLGVAACLVYVFFVAPFVAIVLFIVMMPLGNFFYH